MQRSHRSEQWGQGMNLGSLTKPSVLKTLSGFLHNHHRIQTPEHSPSHPHAPSRPSKHALITFPHPRLWPGQMTYYPQLNTADTFMSLSLPACRSLCLKHISKSHLSLQDSALGSLPWPPNPIYPQPLHWPPHSMCWIRHRSHSLGNELSRTLKSTIVFFFPCIACILHRVWMNKLET